MDKCIVTISHEYGSGGRQIAEILAKDLGIPFYDKDIIRMAAERSGMSAGFIESSDEDIPNTFLHNLKYAAYSNYDTISYYGAPVTDTVFIAQTAVIKDLAAQGSCVIVGRCSPFILRNDPALVAVFVRGLLEDRTRRAVELHGLPQKNAIERVKRIDKGRINYYKYYTNRQWGSVENYDLMVNTTVSGIDGAVAVIKAMLDERGKV